MFVVRGEPKPFPTLYWLACDIVHGTIARFESAGGVRQVQDRLRSDPELLAQLEIDHRRYAAERDAELTPQERAHLTEHGLLDGFANRGIGGIRDLTSVKCLHLHYAHHLARGSIVGRLIEELVPIRLCEPVSSTPLAGEVP